MSDPWHEPVRGGYPPAQLLALSGLAQLRGMLAGQSPAPPISRLTGMRLTAAEPGCATFEMPLSGWLRTPQGAIGIGPLVIPADAAMACAIMTELGPATPFSTSELTLRLLAPAQVGRIVAARGRVIQVRQRLAFAEATLTDDTGELIGHGTSLCLTTPCEGNPEIPATPETSCSDAHASESPAAPDPWERPVMGSILASEIWEQRPGLEVLRAQLAEELVPPPIHHLTGLTLLEVDNGRVAFTLPASEWLCAPARRRVQGGGIALLAESALSAAIQTRMPAATALAPIDLKVNFLRPLHADGRLARADGEVVHVGRRVAVANSRVIDADGRAVAVATGSAMILPGRPASLSADPDPLGQLAGG